MVYTGARTCRTDTDRIDGQQEGKTMVKTWCLHGALKEV